MFNFVNCMCVRQMFPKADIFISFSFLGQLPHMYHWSLLSVIWICNQLLWMFVVVLLIYGNEGTSVK